MPERRYDTEVSEEDIIKVSDSHGNVMEFLEHGGQYISAKGVIMGKFPNPKTNFPRLKEMNIRSDDFFLCAYPKAGTHWTWEIMSMILQQTAEYHPLKKETHMLEFNTPEVLESVTSPRVFNTHLRPNNMPQQFFDKHCKTVFVQRNPKDVAVSFYYHCMQTIKFCGTFIQFMDFFMEKHGPVYHSAWPLYTLEWEKYFKEHPDHPVHYIMYEDLQQDPVSEIKRLAAFMDKPCDDQLANQIAEKCSFQNLKTASDTVKGGDRSMSFYRKGKVGDWKNHFTVALNEEFDQYLQQHKTDTVYKYEI
ncbi:sulfotransferase 1B1-like [Saccostrea echinata]|uniref:sulfotransferase 1B1-like n=1 Tax=Saccostrea echinata TaxID=191078 RepID=UPI002A81D380|nr:sulfotransferase 1B1-like [Saccostrea echinata]